MLTIKKINEITIENNICSIDYIEFFKDKGRNYRTVVDLDLNWLTSYIQDNYGLTVSDWVEKVTPKQLIKLFCFIDETGCNCIDYAIGWPVK